MFKSVDQNISLEKCPALVLNADYMTSKLLSAFTMGLARFN